MEGAQFLAGKRYCSLFTAATRMKVHGWPVRHSGVASSHSRQSAMFIEEWALDRGRPHIQRTVAHHAEEYNKRTTKCVATEFSIDLIRSGYATQLIEMSWKLSGSVGRIPAFRCALK